MNSPSVAVSARPRIRHVPEGDSAQGAEAVEWVREVAGLTLDPWQEEILAGSLTERGKRWAAKEVGVVCPRQNGKNEILLARELVGLFMLKERLIVHSAHQFDTSLEAFRRLLSVIEDVPEFMERIAKGGIAKSHGSEGITLKDGSRITFRTRTGGGGRGFTIDCFVFDESMIMPESFHGTLMPTLLARPNTQTWYTGSAVDQAIHEHGIVLARIRERGIAGDEKLAYFEFSHDADNPEHLQDDILEDHEVWARVNPGYGIRLLEDSVELAQHSMSRRAFAVECLGVGDWPRTDGLDKAAITPEQWAAVIDKDSEAQEPVCFAFDITPDRSKASVVVAGYRSDGHSHVEIIEQRRHTKWIPDFIAGLLERHEGSSVVTDASALDSSLLTDFAKLDIRFGDSERGELVNAVEMARACGMLYDAVEQKTLRHLAEPALSDAIRCAVKRPLSDAWAWSRKDTAGDISPLVAVTLAHWGLQEMDLGTPQFWDLADFQDDEGGDASRVREIASESVVR